jgi:CheY-like chemotaxis protein
MQHAQKLESLGVLAGGIAHDFNNLLVGMLGNASLALLDTPLASPARGPVEDIERAAQRAAELTRQLLAYSGKGRFVIEPIDVSRLVEEMTSLLRAALSKKAELILELPTALPAIEADATQLRQVVMNLLTNASDAIGEAVGTIAIRTGVQQVEATYRATLLNGEAITDGAYVFVDVADTGAGMDGATIARIFDPFFTTKFTGRGLGLAATLGIVRGHRGAIKVYSEPGRGTTFRLLFPASREHPVEAAPPAPTAELPRGTTVLVVDDEAAVRAVARAMLERRGFRVLLAEDGEQAVSQFAGAAGTIDIVLLDLTMPRLDGEQTFRALRTIAPNVRVVLMSGYNQQDVTNQFVGKGLAGFIQKPFRASELYEAIARVVRRDGPA